MLTVSKAIDGCSKSGGCKCGCAGCMHAFGSHCCNHRDDCHKFCRKTTRVSVAPPQPGMIPSPRTETLLLEGDIT